MAKRKAHSSGSCGFSQEWFASYKIGKAITSNFNLEDVLSLVAKIACDATGSRAASVIIVDSATNAIQLKGAFGINRANMAKGPAEFEKYAAGCISAKRKNILIADIRRKPGFNRQALLEEADFCSALCVPVIFNRKFLAVMIFYSPKKAHYTKGHIKIASTLSYQVALAIQNCNLYDNMHINYFNTIRSLVLAMEAKDPYTKGHSERVTEYALITAGVMALAPHQVQMIKYCGLLHDLGKIAISDTILHKHDDLTRDERVQIERHPVEGAAMLSPLAFLRSGITIVRHHHEKFDGTGYPDGLKADMIPLAARILTCADAYDAMTSDRPYRPKITREEAFRELKNNAGSQFDPQVVEMFLKSMSAD